MKSKANVFSFKKEKEINIVNKNVKCQSFSLIFCTARSETASALSNKFVISIVSFLKRDNLICLSFLRKIYD